MPCHAHAYAHAHAHAQAHAAPRLPSYRRIGMDIDTNFMILQERQIH
jgi:hypothetical protein